jgi:carbonic anhydrase/acetyltransferase-like protein (isoleucine patch superfamily)
MQNTNVQDGSVLHTDPGAPLVLGKNVTVGHMAMLHGCTVNDGSLIGIGAVILNKTVVGKHCIIGANTFLAENKTIPDRSLVMGQPGKVVRTLSDEEVEKLEKLANTYQAKWIKYASELKKIE